MARNLETGIPFTDGWKKAQSLTGWSKQSELAAFMEITAATVNQAKKRDNFPFSWAKKICEKYNGSLDWFLSDQGEMSRGKAGATTTGQHVPHYGDGPVDNDIDLLRVAKSVLEGAPGRAQALAGIINALSAAGTTEGKLLRIENTERARRERRGITQHHQRLIEYIEQVGEDDILRIYMEMAKASDFAEWYAKHYPGGERKEKTGQTKKAGTK